MGLGVLEKGIPTFTLKLSDVIINTIKVILKMI
jgi:hypothetical protein